MSDTVKVNRNEVELSEELLTLFAKLLVPEIRKFYQEKAPRVRRLNSKESNR